MNTHPDGEIKGVLAAIPVRGNLVGFQAIITVRSASSLTHSSEAERNMFYDLTLDHPDVKFVMFHSHPDWITHMSGGDDTNFKKVYNKTDGYCDRQLLFHRTESGGVSMKTYRVSPNRVTLEHDGLTVISPEKLNRYPGVVRKIAEKGVAISRIARRHGFE